MMKTELTCCGPQAPADFPVATDTTSRKSNAPLELLPISTHSRSDEVCCGPPAGKASSPFERAGYRICGFVETFIQTPSGPVPKVKCRLGLKDHLGTLRARSGIDRNRYGIAPGLYACGGVDDASPVLVTANYKLSFDALRKHLKGIDAWILVLDTKNINVWCAAGKGSFSTQELIRQIRRTGLERIVSHRRLILPQLAATGVSARQVKEACGFAVVWGPVRAVDLPAFLDAGMKAGAGMRTVEFPLAERLALVPVELSSLGRPTLFALAAIFTLSGICGDIFSFTAAWQRGGMLLAAYLVGVFTGTVLTPALLPRLPGRSFTIKGSVAGLVGAVLVLFAFRGRMNDLEMLAMLLTTLAVSAYLAMNFTGSTPFTSPSGVEKEMKRFIPIQAGSVLFAAICWVAGAF